MHDPLKIHSDVLLLGAEVHSIVVSRVVTNLRIFSYNMFTLGHFTEVYTPSWCITTKLAN